MLIMKMTNYYMSYHESSCIEGRHMKKETWTDSSHWPKEWTELEFKTYPRFPAIELNSNYITSTMSLVEALQGRESLRTSSEEILTFEKLSYILKYSFGLKNITQKNRRYYPSAGARFPLECYILINNCERIEKGIFHYNVLDDTLEILSKGNFREQIEDIFGFEWIRESQAVIFLAAQLGRTIVKYGERGYRFALIEAGHAMQNFCLLSRSVNLSTTTVGGFADHKVSRLLRFSKDKEIPLYSAVIT
ncbi:SagB/ThcOx family dehydrogenase [Ectobacillus antri]|uniref:SagB/ThcOx family dehydrogenase n=1 Tax=Ectobacillus antri TaxID=2486280 RepID=UPI0013DD8EA2|nr:SagB/ThcOx family dehydrogenase [Ectobacillus antri]